MKNRSIRIRILCAILVLSMLLIPGCKGKKDASESSQEEVTLGEYPAFSQEGTLEAGTIYESDDVRIDVTSLEYSDLSFILNLHFENLSDKNLTVFNGSMTNECAAVNGIYAPGLLFSAYLDPKGSTDESCEVKYSDLQPSGINELDEIQIFFAASDRDTFENTYFTVDMKTSLYEETDQDTRLADLRDFIKSDEAQSCGGYKVIRSEEKSQFDMDGVTEVEEIMVQDVQTGTPSVYLVFKSTHEDFPALLTYTDVAFNKLQVSSTTYNKLVLLPGAVGVMQIDPDYIMKSAAREEVGLSELDLLECRMYYQDSLSGEGSTGHEMDFAYKFDEKKEGTFDIEGDKVYDEGGVTIMQRDIVLDAQEEGSDAYYVLLTMENHSDGEVQAFVNSENFQINGQDATFFYTDNPVLEPGESGVTTICLTGYNVEEELSVASPSDITEVSIPVSLDVGTDTQDITLTLKY